MFAKKVSDKERKQMAKQEKKQVALEKKGAGYGMKERVLTILKTLLIPALLAGMYGYLHCHGEQGRRSAAQGTGCGHEVRCGS